MIEEIIKQTYPITKKEKCCAMYKAKMDAKREALRQRLNDRQRENGLGQKVSHDKCEVWQAVLS